MKEMFIYFKMTLKTLLKNPTFRTLYSCLKYYSQWLQHLKPGQNSVINKIPWLTFSSIAIIKKIITPDMTVFEYGSGGSTLFWSSHVKKVISVEHNKEWHFKIKEELLKEKIDNVEYFILEAEVDINYSQKSSDNPGDYISNDKSFTGKNFETYVKKIDECPDNYFDIVLVDGRARPSCILHSLKKIKVNGYLILDNSERSYYLHRFQFDSQYWKREDHSGPAPYIRHFTQTTVFKKLKSD